MAAIIIPTFAGEVPRATPRLLEQTQARIAVNCNLERGSLKPLKGPAHIEDLPETSQTIFRHGNCGWLHWPKVVNVVKSAVYDYNDEEPLGHLFITGDREYPTQYLACGKEYRLGLPRPDAAPVVAIEEGVGTPEDTGADSAPPDHDDGTNIGIERSSTYVYTYVRHLAGGIIQQESAPSPASAIIDVPHGDGVRIGGFVFPPDPNGDMAISHIRLYRSMTGRETSEFHFLCELGLPVADYIDATIDADLSSEVLQTAIWDKIPDDAQGLILTDNGIYAAFRHNELLISEPNIGYAFPEEYRETVADDIVALGHIDGTIVVLTKGRPYLVQGADPASTLVTHLPIEQACMSARSVAHGPGFLMYASPDGLMRFTPNTQELATAGIFTREQWQHMKPETLMGEIHEGRYVGFFAGSGHGFLLHIGASDIVRMELPHGWKVLDMYHHSQDDCIYLSIDITHGGHGHEARHEHAVWQFEAGKPLPYIWRSKPFFTSRLTAMSAIRVDADYCHGQAVEAYIYALDEVHPRQEIHLHDARAKRLRTTRSEKEWALELRGTTEVFEARAAGSVLEVENGQAIQ